MYKKQNPKMADQLILQGDVCGKYIPALPAGVHRVQSNIVAQGEVTGHHHIVEQAEMYADDMGNLFALVKTPTMLLHQEHDAWILHPGVIQFGEKGVMQVEYTGDEERRVRD